MHSRRDESTQEFTRARTCFWGWRPCRQRLPSRRWVRSVGTRICLVAASVSPHSNSCLPAGRATKPRASATSVDSMDCHAAKDEQSLAAAAASRRQQGKGSSGSAGVLGSEHLKRHDTRAVCWFDNGQGEPLLGGHFKLRLGQRGVAASRWPCSRGMARP